MAFIGEIRIFPYNYVPDGWLPCDGSSCNIDDYYNLYQVIRMIYGGDINTKKFKVPDFRGLVLVGGLPAIGKPQYQVGTSGGQVSVTLTKSNIPPHSHSLSAASSTTVIGLPAKEVESPDQNVFLANMYEQSGTSYKTVTAFAATNPDAALDQRTISVFEGGDKPHENMQPSLAINYCICHTGDYPDKS